VNASPPVDSGTRPAESPVLLIPVFIDKFPKGWPEYSDVKPRDLAAYMPIAEALTREHQSDAHLACYSAPEINRRLATELVFGEFALGVPMLLFLVDVEPTGHAKVTPEWWAAELAKLERLIADHPGGFVYRTRGGYRIVYLLQRPVVLSSTPDAARWKLTYLAWLDHLEQVYGVVGDRSCQDWTRLYRLPRVIRDGERQEFETIGNADAIGTWDVAVSILEPEPRQQRPRGPHVSTAGDFNIDDFMARAYPGVQWKQTLQGRRWDIECPWIAEHSSESKRETSVFAYPSGSWEFICLHNHCRNIRNHDSLRQWHDPSFVPFEQRQYRARASGAHSHHASPPPDDIPHAAETAEPEAQPSEAPGSTTSTVNTAGWGPPEPLGDHLLPVEAFNVDLLPADLQAWVCDIAHRMSVPIDIPAIAAMCAVSVIASNARTIHPKRRDPWRVYPILWGVAIAPPGSKKTPATKEVIAPLQRLDHRSRADFAREEKVREVEKMLHDAEIANLKDQLKKVTKDKGKGATIDDLVAVKRQLAEALARAEDSAAAGKPRRYIVQDATVEKVSDIVQRGTSRRCYPLGVIWDELLGFFRLFDREGHETDRTFYLEGWSASTRAVDRVMRGSILMRDLALVVFGNATPEPFEEYVRGAAGGTKADGLLQRFQLMVYPDRLPIEPTVDQFKNAEAERRAVGLYERLAAIDEEDDDGKPPGLRFARDAQDFYFEWDAKLQRDLAASEDHHAVRSHFAKYASLMPAIALVCHLGSGPGAENQPVSLWAAQQAASWCQYLRSHATRIYSLATDPERAVAKQIAKQIEAGRITGEMSVREVYRRSKVVPDQVKGALELLDECGWVRLTRVQTRGRPRDLVAINPRARAA
jgi:hypothetical protein